MITEPTKFDTGHELRDNRVGDLSLWCPRDGDLGFMHLGQIAQILSRRVACPGCGRTIREPEDGPPA